MSLATAAALAAQGWTPARSPAVLREELQRAQAMQERLLGLRIRYDMGLPVQADAFFALSDADRGRDRATLEQQYADEQARITLLSGRLLAVEAKRAELQQQMADVVAATEPGDTGPTLTPPGHSAVGPEPFSMHEESPPAAPEAEVAPPAATASSGTTAEGPPPVLLRGSEDHSRVGRALFKARKFERARQELTAAVEASPDLMDLFYLARSCEALGDNNKADELYLRVEALDTVEVKGQKQPGAWARAARVARRQMQWMQNNAEWQPVQKADSLPWPKR
ncbi:MAG: hypothetical protein R3F56_23895 [Planctomycetota bacterium]